jgi:uncharacterized protein DUF1236
MRYTLLTTVAVATLALGGQVALAQTSQSPSSTSSQMKPPVSSSETSGRSDTEPVQNRGSSTSSDRSEAQPNRNQRQGASSREDSRSPSASSSSAQGQQPTTRAKEGSQDAARSSDSQQRSSQGSSQSATDTRTGSGSASRADTDRQQRTRQEETSQSKTADQPRSTTGANQQREGSTSSTTTQQRPNDARQEPSTARSSSSDQKSTSESTSGPSRSGALASLSSEQRSEVTQAFTSKSVNTVSNVNFDVSVGTTVTSDVHLAPVPDEVVRILPQYRGYRYVVVRDEIVIVEPRTKRVVEVISKSGTPHRTSASLSLSTEQRRKLKSSVETTGSTRSSSTRIELRQGETLPQDVTLIEVPDTIVTEIPELRTYRYVVIGDEIAIVQPDTRRVIEIIE